MSRDGAERPGDIDGMDIDEAVEAVVAGGQEQDAETARATLEFVAEDGVVSHDTVSSTLGEVSKVVATAETRTELAEGQLADARESAAHVDDLGAVDFYLAEFQERFDNVEQALGTLQARLEAVTDRADWGRIYKVAQEAKQVRQSATQVQGAADELQVDLEGFERWLGDRGTRYRELGDDLDALEQSVADLGDAVERIGDAADGDEEAVAADLPTAWADTTLRVRMLDLFLTDVRGELSDLRTWDEREDVTDAEPAAEIEARIDEAAAECDRLADRLDALAEPAWREDVGDDLAEFDAELAEFEPPVDWGEVQRTLETYRSRVGAD
jgi:chromosome segregation ATPase